MRYRLGIDQGTNSLGWWVVELDQDGAPVRSIGGGVRIFGDGRNPKDGTSLAVRRRLPRSARRRRDRYLRRRTDLMNHLISFGLMPVEMSARKHLQAEDPYELRKAALDRPLAPHELGRALFHLGQRRGFKSNRKTDSDDAETGVMKAKISGLHRRIEEAGARTLGEYLCNRRRCGRMVRARPEAGFYPDRAMYEAEFDMIRSGQMRHHALSDTQWDALRDIIFFQRPLRPVDPGWCLYESHEPRAHRALPLTQEFRMVQEANNLRVVEPRAPARRLTLAERDEVLSYLRQKKELKLDRLIKLLKLPSGTTANLFDDGRTLLKGDETAARLAHKDIFGARWFQMSPAEQTEIVQVLLEAENPDDVVRAAQAQWGLDEAAALKLAAKSLPAGYARLSTKAISKLVPVMVDQGLNYAEAAGEVYDSHSDFRSTNALDRLPYYGAVLEKQCVGGNRSLTPADEVGFYGRIGNPTVHIGLNQLRRVVNGLIDIYGKPEEIVIELARELKMNEAEKNKLRKSNAKNERKNREREDLIRAAGGVPSPHLLRKLRLWEEQEIGGIHLCPFTGERISFEMAISDATEIEHILPFAQTLDDSMANKVICLRDANRAKRDRSPYQAFNSDPVVGGRCYVYEDILERADHLPMNKRWRFHQDAMTRFANEERGFLDRQLNETKYLSRIARTYLAHLYDEREEGRQRVRAIPGRLSAMLRGKWGLSSLLADHNRPDGGRKNRDDHRHHAIDAFVVANTTQRLLQELSSLNTDADRKRLVDAVPEPWEGFDRDELREQLERMVVSHKCDHGTPGVPGASTGALHNDTAYGIIGAGEAGKSEVVWRVPLSKFDTPEKMAKGLSQIRDKALRDALSEAWEDYFSSPVLGDDAKPANKAASFANLMASRGVFLGGRMTPVRRVRICDQIGVVAIKDSVTGRPYKAYKPDGNEFAEVWAMPDGKWHTVVVRRFDANQPDFDPASYRPHPAARKVARLHIGDAVALELDGSRGIYRVCKMSATASGGKVFLAPNREANVDARVRAKELLYLGESGEGLRKKRFRKVGVDAIGRLTDPGWNQTSARSAA